MPMICCVTFTLLRHSADLAYNRLHHLNNASMSQTTGNLIQEMSCPRS